MEPGVSFTRLDPEGTERFQRLRADLGVESFGLNLMRLRPGQRGRVHRHERQEEVYLVLEGTLTLELGADEARELGRHELARVAPDVRRRLANRATEPLVLLALGGATPHEGRDGVAWTDWDEPGDGRPPVDVPFPADEEVS
jgi:mannose-6-phosphate isomerase-like protein (cupin superfamily)